MCCPRGWCSSEPRLLCSLPSSKAMFGIKCTISIPSAPALAHLFSLLEDSAMLAKLASTSQSATEMLRGGAGMFLFQTNIR